ncbi:low temperature requirement protein A [Frankia sp. AgB32]|uniref:low temperature requirement protein A n=1 Tax=Frankia sp. AgB32 TaxID=631119 RepID=UPI00200FD70F|nr:low temperature requirement protein A [Frankia sp. AgB32]MCK9897209.1 low temperature requirement protein A [Frankia sp. AgB32]
MGGRRVRALSTVAFTASAFVPGPWPYVLWALALLQEVGHLLLRGADRGRPRGGERPARPDRAERFRMMLRQPEDPARRVDAAHLAERFGQIVIVLLGEVVVAVAASAVDEDRHAQYWLGLSAGLVLAAAVRWIYFTASAPASQSVLRASGGNPTMAYGLYAGGHLSSAFALLCVAMGVSLALGGEAPPPAVWFLTGGFAAYLQSTRSLSTGLTRFGPLPRLAVVAITVCLAFLEPLVSTTGLVLIVAAWAVAIAAYVTWHAPEHLKNIAADPTVYFRPSTPEGRKVE